MAQRDNAALVDNVMAAIQEGRLTGPGRVLVEGAIPGADTLPDITLRERLEAFVAEVYKNDNRGSMFLLSKLEDAKPKKKIRPDLSFADTEEGRRDAMLLEYTANAIEDGTVPARAQGMIDDLLPGAKEMEADKLRMDLKNIIHSARNDDKLGTFYSGTNCTRRRR